MQPVLQPPAATPARRGDVLERAVAAVAEQHVRAPVGDVEIEAAVAVEIAGAGAAAPGRQVHARLLRDVLELPSPEVAIERVPVRDALACRRQLGTGDQIDVEQSVAVVVEQGDAAAGRFEDVVLGRTAAVDLALAGVRPLQMSPARARRRPRDGVFAGAGPIADAWPPYAGSLGLRLAVASLERQAERDFSLELRSRLFEKRKGRGDRCRDALRIRLPAAW